jgi:hypothetical protein
MSRSGFDKEDRLARTVLGYKRGLDRAGSGSLSARKQALMAARYAEQAEVTEFANRAVRQVTDARGVPGWLRFWYASFGREVMKLWRSCPDRVLAAELTALRLKWTLRGLDPGLVAEVESAVTRALEAAGVKRARG